MSKREDNQPASEAVSDSPLDKDAPKISLPDDMTKFFADLSDEQTNQILLTIINDHSLCERMYQLMYGAGKVGIDFLDIPEDTQFFHFFPLFKG